MKVPKIGRIRLSKGPNLGWVMGMKIPRHLMPKQLQKANRKKEREKLAPRAQRVEQDPRGCLPVKME